MTSPAQAERQEHVAGVDGLRGMAALLVIVFHCYVQAGFAPLDTGPVRDFIGAGYFGVDLFFVLSGFVLFLPMVRRRGEPGPMRSYVLRRTGRLLPAYLIALAVAFLLDEWVAVADVTLTPIEGLSHLVFLQTPVIGLSDHLGWGAVGQSWTLSHEVIFYGTLFVVAPFFARRPLPAFMIALAGTLLWRFWIVAFFERGGEVATHLSIQVPSYMLHFALGMLVAVIHVRQPAKARVHFARISPLVLAVALAGVVYFTVNAGHRGFTGAHTIGDHHLRNLGVATSFGLLLLCVVNGRESIRRPLGIRPLVWLGEVSYGAYLYHLFVIAIALRVLDAAPRPTFASFASLLGWTLAATLLAARASYVVVEHPIRSWCRQRADRRVPSRPRERRLPARLPQQTHRPDPGLVHASSRAVPPRVPGGA